MYTKKQRQNKHERREHEKQRSATAEEVTWNDVKKLGPGVYVYRAASRVLDTGGALFGIPRSRSPSAEPTSAAEE